MSEIEQNITEIARDPSADVRISVAGSAGRVQVEVWYRQQQRIKTLAHIDHDMHYDNGDNPTQLPIAQERRDYEKLFDLATDIGAKALERGRRLHHKKVVADAITEVRSNRDTAGITTSPKSKQVSLDDECKIVIS